MIIKISVTCLCSEYLNKKLVVGKYLFLYENKNKKLISNFYPDTNNKPKVCNIEVRENLHMKDCKAYDDNYYIICGKECHSWHACCVGLDMLKDDNLKMNNIDIQCVCGCM